MNDVANHEERRRKALARYESQLAFYEKTKKDARIRYYALQSLVIIASAITPVLIVASVEKWIQAAAPTLATISAGLLAIFQFNDAWLRRARTVEVLKSEFFLFDTRSGKHYAATIPDDQVLETFILRTEKIYADERGEWQRSRIQTTKKPAARQGASPDRSTD